MIPCNAQFLHLVLESRALDAQAGGGAVWTGEHASGFPQYLNDEFAVFMVDGGSN